MKLNIATPKKSFPSVEVKEVTLPTEEKGEIVILPGHARMLSRLGVGTLTYQSSSEQKQLSISNGVVEVKEDQITVLADEAEWKNS